MNGQQYILVASGGEGVHLVLVNNQSGLSAVNASGATGAVGNAIDAAAYRDKDGTTRVVVLWHGNNASGQGVQTLSLLGNHQIDNSSALNSIIASNDARLTRPQSLEIYSPSVGNTYAVVVTGVGSNESRVNIINITDPYNIAITASLRDSDDSSYRFQNPIDVTTYTMGTKHYAAVVSGNESSLTILDITNPNSISVVGSITDDQNRLLRGANTVDVYSIGNKYYAVVVPNSSTEAGIQIIDISTPSNLTAVGNLNKATDSRYTQAQKITTHTYNDKAYALLTAERDTHAVTIIDVTDPNNPIEKAYVQETNNRGDTKLRGALDVETYKRTISGNERHFAVVNSIGASGNDQDAGLQSLELAFLTADAGNNQTRTSGQTVTLNGSASSVTVQGKTFSYEWTQTGSSPTVNLSDSTAQNPTFRAPNQDDTLEFTLTVTLATDQGVVKAGATNNAGEITATDTVTITIKERTQTRNIKELKDTLVQGQITEPTQSTDPDQVGGSDLITGSNEITMIYTEPIATFINSYLNFTISGEDKPRNITGINGSPAIETGETVRINGKLVKTYATILTFDGPPVPPGSTGSMYVQHADYYLAKIQIRDGQN